MKHLKSNHVAIAIPDTLIGNSLYAYEDMEYTHDISLSISETNKSLHFSYANTGSDFYKLDNDLTFKVGYVYSN